MKYARLDVRRRAGLARRMRLRAIGAPRPARGADRGGHIAHLASPPGYPETRTLRQIVRARHGENDGAFEAVLALSPVRVEIVVIAPNGPRLATITWDETGVSEDRSALAPGAVPVESLLGDVFVSLWPRDMVAAALPVDVSVIDEADGGRTISRGGVALVEIRPNPADPTRRTLRNLGFGYELTIANLE
jgi:hypothetical protein